MAQGALGRPIFGPRGPREAHFWPQGPYGGPFLASGALFKQTNLTNLYPPTKGYLKHVNHKT